MSKIKRLIQAYSQHIAIPWREKIAADERVIFCVYPATEERALRAKVDEFELATRQIGHQWAIFDLTDTFAVWLTSQRYARSYFKNPELLTPLLPRYLDHIANRFKQFLHERQVDDQFVVALQGVGSLFGFLRVRQVVDQLAPLVPGRLVVFFPGSSGNNNYRLLDGYDGWNYRAVAITAD